MDEQEYDLTVPVNRKDLNRGLISEGETGFKMPPGN